MGIEYQGRAYRSPRELEARSDTEGVYRVRQSIEVIPINNSTNFIFAIGNLDELGEILEDLRLFPYDIWEDMENYDN